MTAELLGANREFSIVVATTGDHPAILHFLVHNFQQPSANEFQSQLDEPQYAPTNRLLVKLRDRIVAHVRLVPREIMFGDVTLSVLVFEDVAVLPEYEPHGVRKLLFKAAEQRLHDDKALGLLRTASPDIYRADHWFKISCPYYSQTPVHDVLAFLTDMPTFADCTDEEPRLHIRFWRHVELNALRFIYRENMKGHYGLCRRDDAYWHWLVSRRAYDRIYVALEGSPKPGLHEGAGNVVGYAVTKADRILEMMAIPQRSDAAVRLLQRGCRDAIEQDHLELRVDAPPNDPLHSVMRLACESLPAVPRDQQVWLAKCPDLDAPLKWLRESIRRRAKDAEIETPCELGLLLDGAKHSMEVTSRTVRLKEGNVGRSYLTCTNEDFHKLLFGAIDMNKAVEAGRVQTSTRVAAELARTLFPRLPWWISPWDDLPA